MKALPTGAISCKLCASSFHLSGAERVQYAAKGWEAPKACPTCRKLRRLEPPICDDFRRGVCRRQSCRFRHIPHEISLPMTRPSKPMCRFSPPLLVDHRFASPRLLPGLSNVSLLHLYSSLLAKEENWNAPSRWSIFRMPPASNLALLSWLHSPPPPTNHLGSLLLPQLILSYPLSEALSWRPMLLTARSLSA